MLLSTLLILTFLYTVVSGIGVKIFIICSENSLQKRILSASGIFSLTFFLKWVKCCFCLQKARVKHRLCEKSSQEWNGNLNQDKSVAIISTHWQRSAVLPPPNLPLSALPTPLPILLPSSCCEFFHMLLGFTIPPSFGDWSQLRSPSSGIFSWNILFLRCFQMGNH